MATRKTTATKAKQAEATEPKAEPVPETPADAVAPDAEQQSQADAKAAEPTPEKVTETPTPADAVVPDAEQISTDSKPTEIPGDVITGDGTGNALQPVEEIPGVFVRTKRRIKSRRRAGFRFNREGTSIALELLSQEQLEQLLEDPALQVTNCTCPVDEATTSPEA